MRQCLNKLAKLCCICLLVFAISSCSKPAYESAGIVLDDNASAEAKALARLMQLPADDRADQLAEAGHFQLLAYYQPDGSIKIPGIEQLEANPWRAKYGIELAPVNLAADKPANHAALEQFFLDYAKTFNRALIQRYHQLKP